jgi:hypothetical protein
MEGARVEGPATTAAAAAAAAAAALTVAGCCWSHHHHHHSSSGGAAAPSSKTSAGEGGGTDQVSTSSGGLAPRESPGTNQSALHSAELSRPPLPPAPATNRQEGHYGSSSSSSSSSIIGPDGGDPLGASAALGGSAESPRQLKLPPGVTNARAESLAFKPRKAASYAKISLADREAYFAVSCIPICELACGTHCIIRTAASWRVYTMHQQ